MTETASPIEILLVEDSPADVRLMREALTEARIYNRLHVVDSGEDALALLRRPGQSLPDLILLDLNLPGMDGREVLEQIKRSEDFATIPVVVLTTSSDPEDVQYAYKLHTNCYIVKPVDLEQFIRVIQSFQEFWLTIVKLPPKRNLERPS